MANENRRKAIHEIERAAFGLHALDSVTSIQLGGEGIELEDFCVLVGEMAEQCIRRLEAAHLLLGAGRLGLLDDDIEASAADPGVFLRTRCVQDSLQEAK